MGIEIIDPKAIALREKKRTVVMNTRKLHAWVHYYPNPGDHDEHSAETAADDAGCDGRKDLQQPDDDQQLQSAPARDQEIGLPAARDRIDPVERVLGGQRDSET